MRGDKSKDCQEAQGKRKTTEQDQNQTQDQGLVIRYIPAQEIHQYKDQQMTRQRDQRTVKGGWKVFNGKHLEGNCTKGTLLGCNKDSYLITLRVRAVFAGRVRLGVRKRFFTQRVAGHWDGLPRDVVLALSLPEFQKRLDSALTYMAYIMGSSVQSQQLVILVGPFLLGIFCDAAFLRVLPSTGGLGIAQDSEVVKGMHQNSYCRTHLLCLHTSLQH